MGKMTQDIEKFCATKGNIAPFSRDNVLAFVVSLLEQTLVRIGNTEYVRQNNSYGLTTLRDYHARIFGSIVPLNSGEKDVANIIIVWIAQDMFLRESFRYVYIVV